MKKLFAVLSITLAAITFAVPSYSADTKAAPKATQKTSIAQEKAAKEKAKAEKKVAKQSKQLAKLKQKETKAAKKAAKLAKKQNKPEAHAVPEIDGSHAALAIAFLAGAIAITRERRGRPA